MCNDHGLGKAIDKTFGSYDEFMVEFKDITKLNELLGWTWLAYNNKTKSL